MGKKIPIALSALMLLALGCSSPMPTAYEGRLYYTIEEAGSYRIQWMDQYGNNIHYLLGAYPERWSASPEDMMNDDKHKITEADKEQARSPDISRDGRRMVYLWVYPPGVRIYDLVTGQEEMQMANGDTFVKPSFSSLDDKLLFLRVNKQGAFYEILVQNPPNAPQTVVSSRQPLNSPTWSNYGQLIYYSRLDTDNNSHFYSIRDNGSDKRSIADGVGECSMAPQGSELALVYEDKLQIYDTISKKYRVLVEDGGISSPTWNPAGSMVAYVKGEKIYKVDAKGGTPEAIGEPNDKVIDVCWGKGL